MNKVIPIGSWDFQLEPTAVIKLASSGLRGQDRIDLFEKRSAANVFADVLDKLAFHDDEIPIHAIAIGAKEAWGFNRNGDAFDEQTCRDRHHTFVSGPLSQTKTGARLYQHHRNKDPDQSYGYIKASAYNEPMRRIELLLVANAKQAAAQRNGGLVLPDEHLDKLAAGKPLAFSMACRVPTDVCSICHNKAASRRDYCTDETCIADDGFHGFGCRDGLTKIAANGRAQYVDNPDCSFFDFSIVGHPADRTAYGAVADYLQKAASYEFVMGGAALAEQYAHEYGGFQRTGNPEIDKAVQIVTKLAAYEQSLTAGPTASDRVTAMACRDRDGVHVDWSFLGNPGTERFAVGLKAASVRGLSMRLEDYLKYVCFLEPGTEKYATVYAAVAAAMPTVFTKLADDICLTDGLRQIGLLKLATVAPTPTACLAAEMLVADRSMTLHVLEKRAQLAAIHRDFSGWAPFSGAAPPEVNAHAAAISRQFALLKVAMLCFHPETPDFQLTLRAVTVENHCC